MKEAANFQSWFRIQKILDSKQCLEWARTWNWDLATLVGVCLGSVMIKLWTALETCPCFGHLPRWQVLLPSMTYTLQCFQTHLEASLCYFYLASEKFPTRQLLYGHNSYSEDRKNVSKTLWNCENTVKMSRYNPSYTKWKNTGLSTIHSTHKTKKPNLDHLRQMIKF